MHTLRKPNAITSLFVFAFVITLAFSLVIIHKQAVSNLPSQVLGASTSLFNITSAVKGVENLGDGSYLVTYIYTIQNDTNGTIIKLAASSDLNRSFSPYNFSVSSIEADNVTPNSNFNGTTDTALLSSNQSVGSGGRASITLKVQLYPEGNLGPYDNYVEASGEIQGTGEQVTSSTSSSSSSSSGSSTPSSTTTPTTTTPPKVLIEMPECIGDGIYLYRDLNFSGVCYKVTEDVAKFGDTVIGSDRVSSVRIVGNYSAILYRSRNYEGRYLYFTEDIADLTSTTVGNNEASSIQVFNQKTLPDGFVLPPQPPEPEPVPQTTTTPESTTTSTSSNTQTSTSSSSSSGSSSSPLIKGLAFVSFTLEQLATEIEQEQPENVGELELEPEPQPQITGTSTNNTVTGRTAGVNTYDPAVFVGKGN